MTPLRSDAAALILFAVLLTLSFAALIAAWVLGRTWGDLSSRLHYGEALTEEEQRALRRSRKRFWSWACVSLALAAAAFFMLRS